MDWELNLGDNCKQSQIYRTHNLMSCYYYHFMCGWYLIMWKHSVTNLTFFIWNNIDHCEKCTCGHNLFLVRSFGQATILTFSFPVIRCYFDRTWDAFIQLVHDFFCGFRKSNNLVLVNFKWTLSWIQFRNIQALGLLFYPMLQKLCIHMFDLMAKQDFLNNFCE